MPAATPIPPPLTWQVLIRHEIFHTIESFEVEARDITEAALFAESQLRSLHLTDAIIISVGLPDAILDAPLTERLLDADISPYAARPVGVASRMPTTVQDLLDAPEWLVAHYFCITGRNEKFTAVRPATKWEQRGKIVCQSGTHIIYVLPTTAITLQRGK